MNHTSQLTLVLHHSPEVLERVLRVVRHRCFRVVSIQFSGEYLDLEVSHDRSVELLIDQLKKLVDVKEVIKKETNTIQ